jgi:hypothetical protein
MEEAVGGSSVDVACSKLGQGSVKILVSMRITPSTTVVPSTSMNMKRLFSLKVAF